VIAQSIEGSFVAVWWLGGRLLIKMADHVHGDWLLSLGYLVPAFCFLNDFRNGFKTLASGLVHTWITLGGAMLNAIVDGFVEVFLDGLSRDGCVQDRVAFATVVNKHEHDRVGNFQR
jgi:hypothetical protein